MKNDFDVLIIGDGLAASTLGIALSRQKISVCLLKNRQSKNEPIWLENVQTSFLETLANKYLVSLSRDIFFPCQYKLSAWGTTQADNVEGEKTYTIIKNSLIHHLLETADTLSCDIKVGSLISKPILLNEKWNIKLELINGETQYTTTKILIDASGKKGALINKYFTHRQYDDKHITLYTTVMANDSRYHSHMMIESAPSGWWYALAYPNHTLLAMVTNGNYIQPSNYEDYYFDHLANTYYAKAILNKSIKNQYRINSVDSRSGIAADNSGDQWLALGDAAFSVDPLSGLGNQLVLDQCDRAFDAILQKLDEPHSDSLSRLSTINKDIYNEILQNRQDYYLLEKRWRNHPFWNVY